MGTDVMHLADPTRLHGIRCNHRGNTKRTHDEVRVTCGICRGLGRPYETAPDDAFRFNSFMPVAEISGGGKRPGEVLNLHNVIFIDGGSLGWFEEPATFAVMHATEGGTVRRYEGTWEPVSAPRGAGEPDAPNEEGDRQ